MTSTFQTAKNNGKNEPENASATNEFSFKDGDFKKISERVYQLTGIVLKEEKKTLVYSRLAKRLRSLNFNSFSDYYKFVDSPNGKDEIGFLINAITTNLTRFFREEHHFEHIKNVIIPHIVQRYNNDPCAANKRVRFWSAGCSSGEEPYSIAMVLASHMPPGFDVKILATDIDTNMLQKGKSAHYASIDGIPKSYANQFCVANPKGGFDISRQAASLITFNRLNLLEQWPMQGPFNVIFCRNVVIYFNKETQSNIFNRMANLIEPKGWLCIGHSESLFKVCDRFEPRGQTMYQKENEE